MDLCHVTSIIIINLDFSISSSTCSILLSGSHTRSLLSSTDTDLVQKMYAELYSITCCTDLEVHSAYCRYMTVTINNQIYGSYKSRAKSSSIILAKLNNEIRPARINYFAKHNAIVKGISKTHVLV